MRKERIIVVVEYEGKIRIPKEALLISKNPLVIEYPIKTGGNGSIFLQRNEKYIEEKKLFYTSIEEKTDEEIIKARAEAWAFFMFETNHRKESLSPMIKADVIENYIFPYFPEYLF